MQRLTRKIFFSIVGASLLTLLITFSLIMGIYYQQYNTMVLDELTEEAEYAANGVALCGADFLKTLDTAQHISWIAADGTLLYDSDGVGSVSLSDCEEITGALSNGRASDIRAGADGQKIIYYALRLDDGSVLQIASPRPTIFGMIYLALGSLLLMAAILVLLSMLFARWMSTHITRPINELNITSPDESKCYQELAPLVKRIRIQNSFISRQMEELRSKHEEFNAITENMSEGFLLVSANRDIISFNSSARRILDLSRESHVIAPGSTLGQAIDTALGGQRNELEASFGGADYRIITTPVLSDDSIGGAVAIILDITEKSRREAMRREFTSNVSHELKTPLTSINAAADLLSGGVVAPEDTGRFYEMIQSESARMITLINDILRLSQLDENAIPEESTTVDLRQLCEKVAKALRPFAQVRNVSFAIDGSASVTGVSSILEEMIFNLCDNAIKYNKPNGNVRVTMEQKDSGAILSVADTGIGIPTEHHSRIFERFYRVDKGRSREIGGTGLGLSIVRHAANYHNAEISIDSTPGEGTVITVTFP